MKSSERTWEKMGKMAPYYSVLVAEEFKPENLSDTNLSAFFDSGREHVTRLMQIVRDFRPGFIPRSVVDFGCGVGRVTIPLAEACSRVIAVDISESMLQEARKNCESRRVNNVTFMTTREFLCLPESSVGFVHSFIVLQHIPTAEGYTLIAKLISILEDGGVGAIHVSFGDDRSRLRRILSWIKINVPGAAQLHNLLRGQPVNYPPMRMNSYRLDRIFRLLYDSGCHKVLFRFSRHGKHLGLFLIFEKSALEPF